MLKHSLLILLLAIFTSCATHEDSAALYERAIIDSAVTSPQKIVPLKPLPVDGDVTIVSWVTSSTIPCPYQSPCSYITGTYRVWVTLDGEVKQQCKKWKLSGDALRRRLEQLLGLPMDSPEPYRKVAFVTMKVPATRLQRACLGVDLQDPARPACTLGVQKETPDELKSYVQQQMAGSYVVGNPQGPGYPFTRLGYTYDWSPAAAKNHYGASEFLLMPGTRVDVLNVQTTDEYCSN